MEEKKLTDEEIVKALEHCSHNRSCEYCYHNDEVGSGEIVCRGRLMQKSLDLIHRLQGENAEPQKQVDELLNRRIEPKIFQCYADTLENCPKVEQAVKDTAKEIFDWLEKHCFFNGFEIVETYFRERYGVEVE